MLSKIIVVGALCLPMAAAAESSVHPIDAEESACLDHSGGVTANMITCSSQALESWDKALNQVYSKLKEKLDDNGRKALRDAQRLWIRYRDAEFANIDAIYLGRLQGTMWRPVAVGAKSELVKARVMDLSAYLGDLSE